MLGIFLYDLIFYINFLTIFFLLHEITTINLKEYSTTLYFSRNSHVDCEYLLGFLLICIKKWYSMVSQLTSEVKQELLSQILSSPEFHDSKRYSELLQYLAEKSEKVTSLKETEIAIEVFSKDSKFDPNSDPLIRSYISNLRKKLEHYYLTTENKFDYKLVIPKGQYLVKDVGKVEKEALRNLIFQRCSLYRLLYFY